jgi:hypothetical protein
VGEQERDANVPRLQVEGERWQCSASSTIGHCWVMMLSTVATMAPKTTGKQSAEAAIEGFYSIMQTGREKNLFTTNAFIIYLL